MITPAHPRTATMPARLRKLLLTAHVVASVGWLGAVVTFLALSIVGLTTRDTATMRGVYLVMEPLAWYVLVPLAFASLLTGIVYALATPWGLFRHYWVLYKLAITAASTIVLLLFTVNNTRTFAEMASSREGVAMLPTSNPMDHALLALAALLVATTLGVYKPRALTPFGQEAQRGKRTQWVAGVFALVVAVAVVAAFSPVSPLRFVIQLIPTPGGGGDMGH